MFPACENANEVRLLGLQVMQKDVLERTFCDDVALLKKKSMYFRAPAKNKWFGYVSSMKGSSPSEQVDLLNSAN